jgi:hypothetical protein
MKCAFRCFISYNDFSIFWCYIITEIPLLKIDVSLDVVNLPLQIRLLVDENEKFKLYN